jgi:hypothetical protein
MDSVLSQGKEVDFFYDEYRCPIYVKDMVHTISSLTNMWISGILLLILLLMHIQQPCVTIQFSNPFVLNSTDGKKMRVVLNAGGPDRVSRVQMAESVALHRGYSFSLIKSVSASSVRCSSAYYFILFFYLSITRLSQVVVLGVLSILWVPSLFRSCFVNMPVPVRK